MIAEGFLANGANVFLTGRDASACEQAVKDMQSLIKQSPSSSSSSSSGSVHSLPGNLQEKSECERLVAELRSRLPGGKLHVLVNNAGATWGADLDSYPDSAWSKVLTLNLHRVFTLTQLCLPLLEAASASSSGQQDGDGDGDGDGGDGHGPARVIHIGSIDGVRVPPMGTYAYSASKAGLHHLSRALARDLGPRGITSNVLACGPFPTKMMRATLEAGGDALAGEIPLGRIGRSEDVAGAAVFLASKAGAYCNGALIRVDGGASLVSKI
jgi:NAD(P)-dependent dehydrogenase (short-subunit alcohol dehydrogenase family)